MTDLNNSGFTAYFAALSHEYDQIEDVYVT